MIFAAASLTSAVVDFFIFGLVIVYLLDPAGDPLFPPLTVWMPCFGVRFNLFLNCLLLGAAGVRRMLITGEALVALGVGPGAAIRRPLGLH